MTAALPREVKTSEYWPAKLIVRIDSGGPCANCGEPIAYYHDQYLTGDWVHTGTERSVCVGTPRFSIANPVPRCPDCHSRAVTTTAQAWGNATDCPDCGYHHFFSIGD